ncbi:MAG: hypothetical protein HUJ70_14120 [Pseudobutyrivibrio sp.]|nr:hypothetical protein [Pseudobutyrivibrio sp.]
MKKGSNKDNKVVKFKKPYSFSIGFIIIGVMFIYMAYHMFSFLTDVNPTIYEVTQGTISSNKEYNALAIRSEQVITTDRSGNILYLAENFGKASIKTDIYALDESGDIITNTSATSLSDKNIDAGSLGLLYDSISNFTYDFNDIEYYRTYGFKSELERQIDQIYNLSAMSAMEDQVILAKEKGTFHTYKPNNPGLVVYSIDGYEDLTLDNFANYNIDSSLVVTQNLKSQERVEVGQSVYKLITSDHWNLVCEIDGKLANKLSNESYIEIRFLEDEINTWTRFEITEINGKYYMIIYLDDSMDRYANQRFVHIKLLERDVKGLKIPNSSITQKTFFTIPKEYFYKGDDSSNMGLTIQKDDMAIFKSCTIYYANDDYYYIDNADLQAGDVLIKANSSERYVVGKDTGTLDGVYSVNKGYAQFKQIEVIYQNEEYSIIKTGTSYGISMYDHIILQGNDIEENTII